MSKPNTLFAYFSKSPKVGGTPQSSAKNSCDKTPVKNDSDTSGKKATKKKATTEDAVLTKKIRQSPPENNDSQESLYQVGDLVWAKLEGYPYWPSIISDHPTQHQHYKSGAIPEWHVQFFGAPPSRAWIREKFVKKFLNGDDGVQRSSDTKWRKALNAAIRAIKLPISDRLLQLECTDSSDKEDTAGQAELSDVEDDSNIGNRSGKENKQQSKRKGKSLQGKQKRARIITSDSEESGDEYKPDKKELEKVESDSASSGEDEEDDNEIISSDPDTPVKKVRSSGARSNQGSKRATTSARTPQNCGHVSKVGTPSNSSPSSSFVSSATKSRLSLFASSEVTNEGTNLGTDDRTWPHLTLEFLNAKRVDAKNRPISDRDFDPKTIKLPSDFIKTLSPAMKQWWEIKCNNFDTVLFFKVGKFYELYHMDAVIGVKELNLCFMKSNNFAHSGFPEVAYGKYSASLVERGYRVARVEQTETPGMMEERCIKQERKTKFDKVVRREICQVTTRGTRRYGFMDAQSAENNPSYLMAVSEKCFDQAVGESSTYGVCFVDTSIGKFHLGQFTDDRHGSRFRTLLAHYSPVQVLHERRGLTSRTLQILRNSLTDSIVDALTPNSEFWEAGDTLRRLAEGDYFREEQESTQGGTNWPDILRQMQDESDSLGLTAKRDWELAVRSLGACTWYLKRCLIDHELLSMRNFSVYVPIDDELSSKSDDITESKYFNRRQHMILDAATLSNLDVLKNSATGSVEGTLLAKLDHCKTLAGKRLLRQWICAPLCSPTAITERLDAVDDLINNSEVVEKIVSKLTKMPDLERLLSKIHTWGSAVRSKDHPDGRAIFYSDDVFNKRKIVDFINSLNGFKATVEIVRLCKKVDTNGDLDENESQFNSKLLKRCTSVGTDHDHQFPELRKILKHFDNAFDHEKAKADGKIIPNPGISDPYDDALDEVKTITKELDRYLVKQNTHFQCKVVYFGTARNRYQLEIPDKATKQANGNYELSGQRKGFKRYYTSTIKDLIDRLFSAEDRREAALRDVMRKIFESFAQNFNKWDAAVQCMAVLDVMMSIAEYSRTGGDQMCRPKVISPSSCVEPFLEIIDGRHPCMTNVFGGGQFIPNSTIIGSVNKGVGDGDKQLARTVVVTGPNMGGKSTLMRQVGLIAILAQMGSYVPAQVCRMTPIDRVFTRLGASDNIMIGESTFYVELSETAAILQHASEHSLVLMDELGRGTSTYDGVAIAHAVLREFVYTVRCRTLFSTHYHSLVSSFADDPACKLGHMACLVENENEEDPTQETITFLYSFVPGACPKSYGFNAAKLAGISEEVIRRAYKKAKELENTTESAKVFRDLLSESNVSSKNISELVAVVESLVLVDA